MKSDVSAMICVHHPIAVSATVVLAWSRKRQKSRDANVSTERHPKEFQLRIAKKLEAEIIRRIV